MRVAIVNDLPIAVEALRRCVVSEPGFEVAWIAADGLQAVERCAADRPDLVLMDLFMPVMNGVEAIRHIMRDSPCAVLVITASVQASTQEVFKALAAGALDVLDTPTLLGSAGASGAERLCAKLRAMRSLVNAASGTPSGSAAPAPMTALTTTLGTPLLALGASTGGPGVLAQLLSQLREKLQRSAMTLPAVVVVQHIDTAFASGLADWLQQSCGWPVHLAADGDAPAAGTVHMAGALGHLVMTPRGQFTNRHEPRDYPYRPSVDEFFLSCRHWRGRGIAALLTGMGNDGAKGLHQLRQRSWLTLAQLPSSCAVAGMPRAAIQLDAADQVLAPAQIAQTIHDHLLLERPT